MTTLHLVGDLAISAGFIWLVAERYYPALIAKLSPSYAVNEITAGLHALHLKLEAAVAHHTDEADAHMADAAASQMAAHSSQEEASRAALVADKIGALIA